MKRKTEKILSARTLMLAAIAAMTLLRADAQMIKQRIVLTNGWNAVYVSVAPQASADAVFSDWPVWSVSAYNASAFLRTASTTGGATGEQVVRAPYWMWSREAPHASTLKALEADTVLVCFSTSAVPYAAVLRGVPCAPRLAWHASSEPTETLNPVGVRLSGTVKARDWFAGSEALKDFTFYFLSGPDDAAPRFRPIARGTGTAYLNDGDVVFASGKGVSDWSGPLYITPHMGFDFGSESMLDEMSVRNDGADEKTVTISYINSEDGMSRPELLCHDGEVASASWRPFTNTLTRVLGTGETWTVGIALDRSKLANTEAKIGGVLRIEETGGTRAVAWLPVAAKDVKPSSVWPQGLWVANLTLSKVSFYKADAVRTDGVTAGGRMKIKVYVHVDADGTARLLQRVTVKGTRLSSAALPVDLPDTPATSGAFGATDFPLVFNYSIGATSPSNPFRHALHPLFDNKQMDFKTPAPDGDNITNYVGSVKPELFSIGGNIEFSFAKNAATAWSPEETLSGTCKWSYTGVRRDGPVVAEGTFTMQRVATSVEND